MPRSGFEREGVTSMPIWLVTHAGRRVGPGRSGPASRKPPPTPPAGDRHMLRDHAHGEADDAPAARREAAEERGLRRFLVHVERLRVEFAGELLDLRRIQRMGAAFEAQAHMQILSRYSTARGASFGMTCSMAHQMRGGLRESAPPRSRRSAEPCLPSRHLERLAFRSAARRDRCRARIINFSHGRRRM